MSEHTPTPWRVDRRANTRVVAGKDETVAATGCQSSIRDDWEANAAFIAEAANNHERLVETLQEARLQIEYLHERFEPTGTSEAVLARINHVLTDLIAPRHT